MTLNVMTLATINLIVQFLLVIAVLIAVLRVKKMDLGRHCSIMRGAVPVQIISIITVMLPSMIGYIRNEPPGILFRLEIQAHHLLGLAVVVLWIYINLLFMGKVKGPSLIRVSSIALHSGRSWRLRA